MKRTLAAGLMVPAVAAAFGCGSSSGGSDAEGAKVTQAAKTAAERQLDQAATKITPGKPVRLAVFNMTNANSYTAAAVAAIKSTAAKGDAKVKTFDAQFDPKKQIAQLQDATVSKQFDAFIVLPVDGNAIAPVVADAIKSGVKVVADFNTIGPDIASIKPGVPGMTATVAHPLDENGTSIGKLVVQACESKDPCKVAYLPGSLSQATEAVRTKALHAVLKQSPNVKLVAEQEGGYLRAAALKVTTNILQAHPDVDVIASSGDQMTFGSADAVKSAGLTDKVKLVGNGATIEGVAAIRAGELFGSPMLLPQSEARVATTIAINAVRGEKVPASVNALSLSPIGPSATKESLAGPAGAEFKGQWGV
jgi:ribose transport system substrate-binding protein